MCVTFLESEYQTSDEVFFKNDHVISIEKNISDPRISFAFLGFYQSTIKDYDKNNMSLKNVIDLTEDLEHKLFIFVPSGPHHLMIDFFNKIIKMCEKNIKFKVYLNFSAHLIPESTTYFDAMFKNFLFRFLKDRQIEYIVLDDWSKIDYIVANNFTIFNKQFLESSPITNTIFIKYFGKYIKDINVVPFRKVYLNRKIYQNRKIYNTTLNINQDNRLKNEPALEQYLMQNGFESLSPENYFNTFEEQLNYFYETKTLISVTSAGLINAAYMQPNCTVIELVTPQVIEHMNTNTGDIFLGITLHSFWQPITSVKNIDHISISNLTRSAGDILNKIQKTEYLNNIIRGSND